MSRHDLSPHPYPDAGVKEEQLQQVVVSSCKRASREARATDPSPEAEDEA